MSKRKKTTSETSQEQAEPEKYGQRGLPRGARVFVLRSIAEYKTDEWIVEELKNRYGIVRCAPSISTGYRWAKRYKEQIQKYRDRFNKGIEQEPFYSKRYMVEHIADTLQKAIKDKDYGGAARLYKQLTDITGMKAPEHIEHNLNMTGGATYEHKLDNLLESAGKPPKGIEGHSIPLIPETIDIKPEPLPSPNDPK
jgi:hypothetical protein